MAKEGQGRGEGKRGPHLVIQVDGILQGLLRGRCPFEDFLGPVHAHESVHLSKMSELFLRRVPQVVVGLGAFQLLLCVQILPLVRGVDLKTFLSPRCRACREADTQRE